MKLHDLFDLNLYTEMLENGYIRRNPHPTLPLFIINYTEHAQFDREWNEVTLQCRGLIVDENDYVIARPFDKFFNYGEPNADVIEMDEPVDVLDKMDGSLGILWQYRGEQGIATRGSFTSDQAIHATKLWHERYKEHMGSISTNWTYLFEIIYPENRIVLNYGAEDDLVLLGIRSISQGSVIPPAEASEWFGPSATTYRFRSLSEALAAPARDNAEGFVITSRKTGGRIKVKQEDYIALHKIVTGLTKRRIWENMKNGMSLEQMCEIVPDEWHEWLRNTYFEIDTDIRGVLRNLDSYFTILAAACVKTEEELGEWEPKAFRKNFAEMLKDNPYRSMFFLILDGKDEKLRDTYYNMVKPEVE